MRAEGAEPDVFVRTTVVVRKGRVDLVEHLLALSNLTKYGVLAVQLMQVVREGYEKARVVQVRAEVGHRDGSLLVELELRPDLVPKVARLLASKYADK